MGSGVVDVAGTKNPLSEYNEAFRLLQRRRKILPVSAQGKSSPVSVVRRNLPNDSEATEIQVETLTDTNISHRLQEPRLGSQSDPFIDSFEEEDVMQEDEAITEVARIIEDLENGVVDPTLAILGEEDVLLDMDDTFVYQDDDFSDTSSEGTVEDTMEDEQAEL